MHTRQRGDCLLRVFFFFGDDFATITVISVQRVVITVVITRLDGMSRYQQQQRGSRYRPNNVGLAWRSLSSAAGSQRIETQIDCTTRALVFGSHCAREIRSTECVCVCLYVCLRVCVRICVFVYVFVSVYVYLCVCVYVYEYV